MNAPQNMPKSPHAQTALAAAQKYGLPPGLFLSQINAESAWNPNAKSPAGALGIAQFMPATAKGLGVNPMDPNSALDGAARLMSQHFNTYKKQGHDDVEAYKRALSAYNAGPGAVQKYNGVPPYKETQNYVKRIMAGLM